MGRLRDTVLRTRRRESSRWPLVALFLLLSLSLHGALVAFLVVWSPDWWVPEAGARRAPMRLVIVQPPEEEEPEEEEEDEERPELDGQLVEVPPREEVERPEDADYVAEVDVRVEVETRTDEFEINPDVLAPEFSEEQAMEEEDLIDLDVDKPSTGAQVGNDKFDPSRDGKLAALPSPWALTNKDGLQDPVPAAHRDARRSGAPQNDLLDEQLGDEVALNTKEYLYAAYLQRIRRMVNFYWEQNLDNLPSSVQLVRSSYTTAVAAVLDSEGALELVEVTRESGSEPLDDCVTRAFRVAGPFPNPPEGLIEKDGRVYLPGMSFTVRQGQARMRYQGVDPRAGVQFPGILKAPR